MPVRLDRETLWALLLHSLLVFTLFASNPKSVPLMLALTIGTAGFALGKGWYK